MRKKKLKNKLSHDSILHYITYIMNIIYLYINEDKLLFSCDEHVINNKKQQQGILFKVMYKSQNFLSLFFPYDAKYVINIDDEYIVSFIYTFFLNKLICYQADDFEQNFIINNINRDLNKINDNDDKIKMLNEYKQYFNDKFQDHINSLILLYKL